jgi:hypothetical protein
MSKKEEYNEKDHKGHLVCMDGEQRGIQKDKTLTALCRACHTGRNIPHTHTCTTCGLKTDKEGTPGTDQHWVAPEGMGGKKHLCTACACKDVSENKDSYYLRCVNCKKPASYGVDASLCFVCMSVVHISKMTPDLKCVLAGSCSNYTVWAGLTTCLRCASVPM